MNCTNFTGRLTAPLELKKTQEGKSFCNFSLAVKRPRTKDITDFINFVAWQQTAEYLTSYAQKGTLIEATGVLTSRKWQDKEGNNRTSFEVKVDNASILESVKPDIDIEKPSANDFTEFDIDGDLPF